MSKTTLSLKLLTKLASGRLYKKSELADYLEVTERKLIELRYDLIDAGFYIETISGVYGGYRLDKSRSLMLSNLNINNEEFNSLKFIEKTLGNDQSVHHKNFHSVVEKLEANLKNNEVLEYQIIKELSSNRLIEIENDNFEILLNALKCCSKVKFSYKKLDATIKEYTWDPYELFFYKGFWYLITYNEKYNKAYQYKLVRMKHIEILDERYKKSPQFKLSDFTGVTSIFKGEMYHLVLKITPPSSVFISELQVALNQEIIEESDGSIIFKGSMEGKVEILAWLLSLGENVTIIEPIEIKTDYQEKLRKMMSKIMD
ncbi:MAG: hypothetical protein K0Q49_1939 [Haloplasmataceae bacterium]|jgi:predicted DNA-binding transcriptional regulator YafY|nr:hypothetical protein [Haloplasmataceae bacterium]